MAVSTLTNLPPRAVIILMPRRKMPEEFEGYPTLSRPYRRRTLQRLLLEALWVDYIVSDRPTLAADAPQLLVIAKSRLLRKILGHQLSQLGISHELVRDFRAFSEALGESERFTAVLAAGDGVAMAGLLDLTDLPVLPMPKATDLAEALMALPLLDALKPDSHAQAA